MTLPSGQGCIVNKAGVSIVLAISPLMDYRHLSRATLASAIVLAKVLFA